MEGSDNKVNLNNLVSLVREGKLSKDEALKKVDFNFIQENLYEEINPSEKNSRNFLAKGTPLFPGIISGTIILSSDKIPKIIKKNKNYIFISGRFSLEDIKAIKACKGIICTNDIPNPFLEILSKTLEKPCITNCSTFSISQDNKSIRIKNKELHEKDIITMDANTGEVFLGNLNRAKTNLRNNIYEVFNWMNENRNKKILTIMNNMEQLSEININYDDGLVINVEEFLFEGDNFKHLGNIFIGNNIEENLNNLEKTLEKTFEKILPLSNEINIKFLDKPLYKLLANFVDRIEEEIEINKKRCEISTLQKNRKIINKIKALSEANTFYENGPRLIIANQNIYEAKLRALFRASLKNSKNISIIIPDPINVNEIKKIKEIIKNIYQAERANYKNNIKYEIGIVIESPVSLFLLDKLSKEVDFVVFNIRKITEKFLGISKENFELNCLSTYLDKSIIKENPFENIDKEIIGKLIKENIIKLKNVKKGIKVGIINPNEKFLVFLGIANFDFIITNANKVESTNIVIAKLTQLPQA